MPRKARSWVLISDLQLFAFFRVAQDVIHTLSGIFFIALSFLVGQNIRFLLREGTEPIMHSSGTVLLVAAITVRHSIVFRQVEAIAIVYITVIVGPIADVPQESVV